MDVIRVIGTATTIAVLTLGTLWLICKAIDSLGKWIERRKK